MRPIPQTVAAAEQLRRSTGEVDLLPDLMLLAERVKLRVPDCVGLSVRWNEHGLTLMVMASEEELALLDGLQRLAEDPDHVLAGRSASADGPVVGPGPWVEDEWRRSALATAARGVRSSLSLPVLEEGEVIGSFTLYGASDRAFEDDHADLAAVLGGWAPGAVRNADLSFSARREAESAPQVLRDQEAIRRAVRAVTRMRGFDAETARRLLQRAARRSGVTLAQFAHTVIDGLTD